MVYALMIPINNQQSCDKRCDYSECGYDGFDCKVTDDAMMVPLECSQEHSVIDEEQAYRFIQSTWNRNDTSYCLSRVISHIDLSIGYVHLDLSPFYEIYEKQVINNVKVDVTEKSIDSNEKFI